MTITAAARTLKVSESRVRAHIRKGRIKVVEGGRRGPDLPTLLDAESVLKTREEVKDRARRYGRKVGINR